MNIPRNRLVYFFLIVSVVILGLLSRKYSYLLPQFVAQYSGDTLWALMMFFIFRLVFIGYSVKKIAFITLAFSFLIELSQLCQADWINSIRATRLGGLVLGYGFLWSDLLCYTAGVGLGVIAEKVIFIGK